MGDYLDDMVCAGDPEAIREQAYRQGLKDQKKPATVPCGVAVFIWRTPYLGGDIRQGEFLMGLRKGAHGAGTWSFPGGRVEPNEDLTDAAKREVKEETGIILPFLAIAPMPFNNTLAGGQPWVTLFFQTQVCHHVTPAVMEPEKCERWAWFPTFQCGYSFFQEHTIFEPAAIFLKEMAEMNWEPL